MGEKAKGTPVRELPQAKRGQEVLSTPEIAKRAGCSVDTVVQEMKRGCLSALCGRSPRGAAILVATPDEVQRWLDHWEPGSDEHVWHRQKPRVPLSAMRVVRIPSASVIGERLRVRDGRE